MSHTDFLKKFYETFSKKHNDVIDEDIARSLKEQYCHALALERKMEETEKYLGSIPCPLQHGLIEKQKEFYYKNKNDEEIQAIIDILGDPLIARHRCRPGGK